MKNNKTHEDRPDASQDATSASNEAKGTQKNNKSKPPTQKADSDKKKSFRRSWRAASPIAKLTVIFVGLGAFGTIAYLGATIWQTLEVRWSAHAQHMPLLINSRPPELLQAFVCDASRNQIHAGNIQTTIKNIGSASAYHVMPFFNVTKIVPEKKTGDKFVDTPPQANCKIRPENTGELDFPLAPGRDASPQIRQMGGNLPSIKEDDPVQFYWVSCVYYTDEYGGDHGTCDRYQLHFPTSANPLDVLSGAPTFVCDGTPKIGKFTDTIGGHCQE